MEYLTLDKHQGDLRVDLTEPEKAFDWIRIKNLRVDLTEPDKVLKSSNG